MVIEPKQFLYTTFNELVTNFFRVCCRGNANLFMLLAAAVDRLELLSAEHLLFTCHPYPHPNLSLQLWCGGVMVRWSYGVVELR